MDEPRFRGLQTRQGQHRGRAASLPGRWGGRACGIAPRLATGFAAVAQRRAAARRTLSGRGAGSAGLRRLLDSRALARCQWASGCRNGAELSRLLKERGFRGSLRVVTEWATRRRRSEKADAKNLQRIPSARTIARLMTIGHHVLSKPETVTNAAIENGVPLLVERECRRKRMRIAGSPLLLCR
jgi:hypothetical protein